MRLLAMFTNLFPVWVLAAGVLALVHPPLFTWFSGPFIVWGLAVVMLGMGITLSLEDFRRVARQPGAIAAAFVAQYTIMPLLGWAIANLLRLPDQFAAGLILVACCPGGTASNVVTFLARGDVALSVLMTMCSTFGAVAMTPLLTNWLAGKFVPVDAVGLLVSTAQVVLIPLIVGLALSHWTPRLVRYVLPAAPLVSVITIALICASIIGQSAQSIIHSGARLVGAVFLLHAGGFGLGYLFAKMMRYHETSARTISIEVGMQNSGLGAVLARQHFSVTAAAPCAISSIFHSVIGSLLAAYWRTRPGSTSPPSSAASARETVSISEG